MKQMKSNIYSNVICFEIGICSKLQFDMEVNITSCHLLGDFYVQ